jgi:hypothetical protein
MKTTSNTNDPNRDDAVMRQLLLLADRQEIQPPRDVVDRVRAKLHENTVRSPSAAPQAGRRQNSGGFGVGPKRAWFAGAGAAAVVLIALLFWWMQPSTTAWSQVVETVRTVPWIHGKAVGGDGKSQESWASFSRNIGAIRAGNMIRYDDFRSGIRYEYDTQQKKLFRLSTSGEEVFKSEEGMFRAIFRGDATLGDSFPGHPIVRQRQRTVNEQGRRWILYELEFGDPDNRDPGKTMSVVVRVDPERMLPDSMTFSRGDEKRQLTIDYPADGPADIYALGVPRDAPVEDRMPSPDLDRIIKIVQRNRRDFGNYLAVAGGGSKPSILHLVRCKGDKFRVDVGIGDTKHVASGDDMEKWWREHGKETLPEGSLLCDGRRVYEHSLVSPETGWKPLMDPILRQGDARAAAEGVDDSAQYFVDLLAYTPRLDPQQLASSRLYTARLDPKGENGPAGSVRVELLLANQGGPTDRRAYHKEEFWLEPKYGYAVVKHVFSDCPAVDEDPLQKEKRLIYEYDDFRQTPRGMWYPTLSRWKNASQSENKNEPGGVEFHDQITYFYLDFTAKLPDGLFSPEWQGDLLGGISFAQQLDKPTSKDLGKIRPPGGVPLISPGSVITVQAGARVRQRLEAVPKKDLEKWVVELERIMDMKLKDGLPSARQACRTDFVTHMSVAFDGLKWNAKSADAKAWKKAFEALLKKKIGQTDTEVLDGGPAWAVPLVLIPVDALYEGQKYSAERAKKYLARLKQLTADDVSLWKDKVDEFGGTRLDAAVNIILLDDYFENEKFQRDKFKAAIAARLGGSQSAVTPGSCELLSCVLREGAGDGNRVGDSPRSPLSLTRDLSRLSPVTSPGPWHVSSWGQAGQVAIRQTPRWSVQ